LEVSVAEHLFEDGVEFLDFVAERMRDVDFPGWFDGSGQAGSEHTLIEPDQEQAGVAAVGGEFVAGGFGLTTDEALAPESAQIIGHLRGAIIRQVATEQGRHVLSQLGVSEAGRQCQKQAKRREEGHDSGLAEFEARGFLTVGSDGRLQEPLQALLAETAVLTGPFDLQQPMVDVPGNLFEVRQVLERLAHPEIQGIVDGAFGARGAG
jgi:hypothetical protein